MSQGDYTMGSKDISQSDRAKKRRAVAACRNPEKRKLLKVDEISCVDRAMNGDVKSILEALNEGSK